MQPGVRALPAVLRPVQFVGVGGITGLIQLGLLAFFQEVAGLGSLSNAVSFVIAAELNFLLNYRITWGDRMTRTPWVFVRQLAFFTAMVTAALPINQGAYLLAEKVLPYIIAGGVGIVTTTAAKYLIADRLIFSRRHHPSVTPVEPVAANEA